MLNLQPATLRNALDQLDHATHTHLEWHANLLRIIVSEPARDPNALAATAYHQCRFDRWMYERAPVELWDQPTFAATGIEHQRVHSVAAGILRDIAAGLPVERQAFDDLIAGSLRLHREIDLLRRELQVALRNCDALTGAYDRDQALPQLRQWRAAINRGAIPCCIVLMDLDRLKDVNEKHGYLVGDALLAEAVSFLGEHLRADDRVFRYGGDEFLISLPGADLATARAVIARVREGLGRRQLFVAGANAIFHLTASFGLALLDPEIRVEDSIDHAAQALLLAKAAGGNRTISWDSSATTGRLLRRLTDHDSARSSGAEMGEDRSIEGRDDASD